MMDPHQELHYNRTVWVSPAVENLRRDECLCLHCGVLGQCDIAKELFYLAKEYDLAFPVSRCPSWQPKD